VKKGLPLILDGIAQRYGVLPHELYDLDLELLQIDTLCWEAGIKATIKAREEAEAKNKNKRY